MPSRRVAGDVAVVPFTPDGLPSELAALAPAEVLDRWRSADRSARSPEIVAVLDGDAWSGAALVTARAGAAYRKIVDAAGDVPAVVAAVERLARERGLVQLKWEGWTVSPADAAALGFTPLRTPLESAVGTGEPAAGHVRWLAEAAVSEPPYYRQTEDFTCGAVVALMAQAGAGAVAEEAVDRAAELALWRSATNFPACEPVGLGVAVRRMWPDATVEVALDVDRPVMVGHLPEPERRWRAVLQRSSRADAAAIGLAVDGRRIGVDEVRAAIGRGERALLLVSLARMQGFDVPHWVLCHGTAGGAVVIEDPWTGAATGDTWVDAHLLPIGDASLDEMSALEEDGYRGVVRIGPPDGLGRGAFTAAS